MKKTVLCIVLLFIVSGMVRGQERSVKAKHDFKIHNNVTWASPGDTSLTLDIYVPQTAKETYPVLVIYHGGGWLINDNSPMDALSKYIASNSEFIVCNMNYRLLPDKNNTITMDQIVEDAFGGLLWVKQNIASYGGDSTKVAITGDSAGGHLAEMIVVGGRNLENDGFEGNSLGFNPTYLPLGKTAEEAARQDGLNVQAAIISYGAFDIYESAKGGFESSSNGFWQMAQAEPRGLFGAEITVDDNSAYYKAVSPIFNIPEASDYRLPPQFFHGGSNDQLTTPASIKNYVSKLEEAEQPAEVKIYPDRPHAFLDGGCNEFLDTCFEDDAPPVVNDMIDFLNETMSPKK